MQILLGFFLVVIFLLLLFLVLLIAFMLFDFFLELPFVGTQHKKIGTIFKLANIKPKETVVDLGSGDGRLLVAVGEKGAMAIGYEINPIMIAISLIHAKLSGVPNNVWIQRESLWKADLKKADVIFVYAKRKSMKKFEEFIYKNAAKGTRIVVNTNPFPNKKPQKEENGIFLYTT